MVVSKGGNSKTHGEAFMKALKLFSSSEELGFVGTEVGINAVCGGIRLTRSLSRPFNKKNEAYRRPGGLR